MKNDLEKESVIRLDPSCDAIKASPQLATRFSIEKSILVLNKIIGRYELDFSCMVLILCEHSSFIEGVFLFNPSVPLAVISGELNSFLGTQYQSTVTKSRRQGGRAPVQSCTT